MKGNPQIVDIANIIDLNYNLRTLYRPINRNKCIMFVIKSINIDTKINISCNLAYFVFNITTRE